MGWVKGALGEGGIGMCRLTVGNWVGRLKSQLVKRDTNN